MSITAKTIAVRFGLKALKSIASKWWANRVEKHEAKRALKAVRGE